MPIVRADLRCRERYQLCRRKLYLVYEYATTAKIQRMPNVLDSAGDEKQAMHEPDKML